MPNKPRKNPQAWGKKLKELREEIGRRRGVKLSFGTLADDFSKFSANLSDRESAGLQSLGAVTYLGVGPDTLRRYENGERSPDLDAILFMIYYFKIQGVIDLDEADQWLALAAELPLQPDEIPFLFGKVVKPEELLPPAEEVISITKQGDDNTFTIPNEYIPEHSGYTIFKGKHGLVLKLITVFLLVIGIAITFRYSSAIVERLKSLLPQPTPTSFELTPQPSPSVSPTPTVNADAYYKQGSVYVTQKKWPEAIAAFTKAIELKPDYVDVYYNRGFAYTMTEEWQKAIDDLTKYIQLKPGNLTAYYDLGRAHNGLKQWDNAITDFTKYIQFNPDNFNAYYGRGMAYINTNRWDEAIADFTKYIQFNPDHADSYYNRGLAYAKQKKWSDAATDFTKAIELNPDNADVYYNLGVAREFQGELNEAIADYRHYLQMRPTVSSRSQIEQRIIVLEAKVSQQK